MTDFDKSKYTRKVIEKKGVGAKWNAQALLEMQSAWEEGYRFISTGLRQDEPCFNWRGNSVRVIMYKPVDGSVSASEEEVVAEDTLSEEIDSTQSDEATEATNDEQEGDTPKRRGRTPKPKSE